jgi:TonB-dependent SusC/RagA subfamily outer membrane receptor
MKNDFKSRVCRLALAVILLLGSTGLAAQQSEIKPVKSQVFIEGKITDDATGEPINAATIKMGKSSAFTNEEGLFKLQVIGELKPTIIVTAPGYDTREVPHRGQAVMNFTLSSDQFGKALGSKPKKAELDEFINKEGAAVVTMEEIDLTNPMESVESVLQSKFGTIRSVTHSGMPGVGAAMFLRGINTLNVNAKPLFILDGVMLQNFDDQASVHDGFFSNPLTHIDLREVESITVIKDAVSLYGAKAANGVVMIETRRSKDMVTHITANINGGVRSKRFLLWMPSSIVFWSAIF